MDMGIYLLLPFYMGEYVESIEIDVFTACSIHLTMYLCAYISLRNYK